MIVAFGSAGQAGKIKPLSLDKMAESYRKPVRKIA
jgi:hypothetical protein